MRLPVLLSVYWFLLLGALGIVFPFYSLYLSENAGLSGTQVGLVLAMLPLVGFFAQPLWGHAADRSGSRTGVLTILSFGAAAGYTLLYLADGFVALLLGTMALAVFSAALIPACVSASFALLGTTGRVAFGRVRVWGTVGFLVTVVGFPRVLSTIEAAYAPASAAGAPSEPLLALMLPVTGALCFLAGLFSLALPRGGSVAVKAASGDWRLLLANQPFRRMLGFMVLCYFCLQGPIALFPLFVRSIGGGIDMVSKMWIAMLLLEIPLVALSGASFERLGARGLLAVGVGSGALRWLVTALASDMRLIYAAQVLHGLTVMGLIIGSPLYVDAVVPQRLRSTAQGLLSMVGISLGGVLSSLTSGWLVDAYGATTPALLGGIGALVLTAALPWLVPPVAAAPRYDAIGETPVDPSSLG